MSSHHKIESLAVTDSCLSVSIDGKEHTFELAKISTRLAGASKEERTTFEVSSSGYGIHWPLLDEDLSVDGLLGVDHSPKGSPQESRS